MVEFIGERVRYLRKKKGLTLAELSKRTGLSVASLSTVERDRCSPTLDNIQRICAALDISLVKLLEDRDWNSNVIYKNQREVIFEQVGQILYESINYGPDKLDGLIITVEPHCEYNKEWTHSYDEIGLVLDGELTITINNVAYTLNAGDSFYIDSMTEHSLSNLSKERCTSYWVKQGQGQK